METSIDLPPHQECTMTTGRCAHSFHFHCIVPWLKTSHACPLCCAEWEFASSGPLSGANGALPWMVFVRDRAEFEREFPELEVARIEPFLAFRYLVSGGVSMRSLMPGFTHGVWAAHCRLAAGDWCVTTSPAWTGSLAVTSGRTVGRCRSTRLRSRRIFGSRGQSFLRRYGESSPKAIL